MARAARRCDRSRATWDRPRGAGPAVDAYALRLVAARTLYDGRIAPQRRAVARAARAPSAVLLVHPSDRDRIGVAPTATSSRVTSARGTSRSPVRADAAITPGTAFLAVQPAGDVGADDLVDADRRRHRPARGVACDERSCSCAPTRCFSGGIDLEVVLIVIGKTIVVFACCCSSVLLYIWFLRKVIADMQNRIGPDRAGPFGMLQTLADGIKLFFKEQSIPDTADRLVFRLAPVPRRSSPRSSRSRSCPIGGEVSIAGHQTYLQLADPPIGVLFLLTMSGIGLYGVMLAGWSSGSKYPLLGSVRASAQLLRYEAAFGLAIVGVLVHAGTLSTRGIVDPQAWTDWDSFVNATGTGCPAIVAFVIFVIAAIAETNHPPFDLVEAEQELVGGFHTEYTGIRFAIFFLAEFMNLITMSAIAVTLFLGGPSGPASASSPPTAGSTSGSCRSSGSSSSCSCSCSRRSGCGPRCPGCATTSSWTSAGSGSSSSRSSG